jgi:gas vesicle protein
VTECSPEGVVFVETVGPLALSLHQPSPFAIFANSHHPNNLKLQAVLFRDWPLKQKGITSMGNDRDYGDGVSTRLTYFLVGAGIGAVLALLFAPKSGEELRSDIADATRKGIDKSKEAAQQLGAKAGEYYETGRAKAGELYDTTRERAGELYDTATAKAGDVVTRARDAAAQQAGSISAAVEAGKKAYVEEKRKTELSGRTEAAPTYTPEKSM